jgi:histone H3/H4
MKSSTGVRKDRSDSFDSDDRMAKKQKLVSPKPQRTFGSLPKALQSQLNLFWKREADLIQNIDPSRSEMFENDAAPLARIKKIMKLNPNVCLIGSEVPVVLVKACELFMRDLTMRTWTETEERKRKTLGLGDLETACRRDEVFDFLIDFTSDVVKPGKEIEKRTTTTTTSKPKPKAPAMSEAELVELFLQQQKKKFSVDSGSGVGAGVGVGLTRPPTPPSSFK